MPFPAIQSGRQNILKCLCGLVMITENGAENGEFPLSELPAIPPATHTKMHMHPSKHTNHSHWLQLSTILVKAGHTARIKLILFSQNLTSQKAVKIKNGKIVVNTVAMLK